MCGPQDPAKGRATLTVISAMLGDMGTTDRRKGINGLVKELAQIWNDDMVR